MSDDTSPLERPSAELAEAIREAARLLPSSDTDGRRLRGFGTGDEAVLDAADRATATRILREVFLREPDRSLATAHALEVAACQVVSNALQPDEEQDRMTLAFSRLAAATSDALGEPMPGWAAAVLQAHADAESARQAADRTRLRLEELLMARRGA
ncbi:hypothetical protein [Rhodovastum atsumiense]|uniref:Uncharacterized protein n=1 Tax=Rhodovastum atsumiense TaxID=504468 RepID=A0A5M6ILL1_9PROT|nr:hypothetical protein [Rhodovastum atsumiense]KAA5609160.1 hypothetical protein F1189_25650 [Rhodovastum atsumiense]